MLSQDVYSSVDTLLVLFLEMYHGMYTPADTLLVLNG